MTSIFERYRDVIQTIRLFKNEPKNDFVYDAEVICLDSESTKFLKINLLT